MGNSLQEVEGVDGNGGEKPQPLPLPTGSGGIVGSMVGVGRERPLPLLLLAGLGGVVGGVVGVGGERPLPLPLHEERPPDMAPLLSMPPLSQVDIVPLPFYFLQCWGS